MLPNRIMYVHPNSKLSRAQIRDERAKYLKTGSFADASSDKMLRIAL